MNTALHATPFPQRPVRDIMSPDVVSVSPDMTLREAIEVLDQHQISGAPVVTGRALVGVLSASDLLAFEASTPAVPVAHSERPEQDELETPEEWVEGAESPSAYFTDLWDDAGTDVLERIREPEGPEWDLLAEHTVGEAMSMGVRCVQASATLQEAAAYMVDNRIHRALVLKGGDLAGVVTATDFLRALAERPR